MLLKSFIIFYFCTWVCDGELLNRYDSTKTTDDQLLYYQAHGAVDNCTVDVQPCNESDWRSMDGTCNNLKEPARGAFFVPMERILPPHYFNGSYERKAEDGGDLPLPRYCRTTLLQEGISHHHELSLLVNAYAIFMFLDVGSVHDINRFLVEKTDCCQAEHMNDYACTPNIIPENDPVHRFSGIRCMNLTRPLTYQDFHCTNDTVPSPVVEATVVYDLSGIYQLRKGTDKDMRSYTDGLLKVETEDGKIWPPNQPAANCLLNEPGETRCFKNVLNGLLPINLLNVWGLRMHNYIAKNLAAVSPCWDDERLFQTSRDINIAVFMQIYLYEWMTTVIGHDKLVEEEVIGEDSGFRETYDETLYPKITLEFSHALRFFHILQDATAELYHTNGTFIDFFSMTNLSLRPGWLAKDNHMTYVTQGAFRQRSKAVDHSVHPNMAELGIPKIQRSVDIVTSDLHKSRLFGMAPYIDYLYLTQGLNITCFDDLKQVMSEETLITMKKLYKHPRDIDLMAGLWTEKVMEGGQICHTLAWFIMDNMKKAIRGDRHHYERENRPHALTADQLKEIRKSSIAMLLCKNGDGVTHIQENAFLTISDENPLVCCSEIPSIDFSKWADSACTSDSDSDSC